MVGGLASSDDEIGGSGPADVSYFCDRCLASGEDGYVFVVKRYLSGFYAFLEAIGLVDDERIGIAVEGGSRDCSRSGQYEGNVFMVISL